MKKSKEDISQIDAGISRNNQNRWWRVRVNGSVIFDAFVFLIVITILAFFQTTAYTKEQQWFHIVLIGVQTLVSVYAGHKIFPKIFKNDQLISFQKNTLRSIIAILKSKNQEILSFQLLQLVSQTIADIDQKVTTDFLKKAGPKCKVVLWSFGR
ncbi:MAG: hypothetical protein OXF60_10845 [Gammaproteobacteria bacterium]|nr:hypothetical protein [Gammaproteobacteria bacterium]